ncbi:hypothetical protein C5167_048766, partial [Papaver somniferum]
FVNYWAQLTINFYEKLLVLGLKVEESREGNESEASRWIKTELLVQMQLILARYCAGGVGINLTKDSDNL